MDAFITRHNQLKGQLSPEANALITDLLKRIELSDGLIDELIVSLDEQIAATNKAIDSYSQAKQAYVDLLARA